MKNMYEIFEKYNVSVIENLDKNNFEKIVLFLENTKCECILDIITDYLDLFIFQYDEFVKKYNFLNKKYDYLFWNKVSENMNLLEEFYLV